MAVRLATEPQSDLSTTAPLPLKLAAEFFAAFGASFAVSPLVYIVDRSIVSNMSGRQKLLDCVVQELKVLVTRPGKLLGSVGFRWIWGVYLGTYTAANFSHAVCDHLGRSWQLPKFFASSAANMSLSVLKDRTFARLYGTGTALRIPAITYALFTVRDLATVACSFNVPPMVSELIHLSQDPNMPEIVRKHPMTTAQLLVPTALQFFSTPVHLLALDCYNRQGTPERPVSAMSRAQYVAKEYPVSTVARMARILPAFGIGGILNGKLRAWGSDLVNGMD